MTDEIARLIAEAERRHDEPLLQEMAKALRACEDENEQHRQAQAAVYRALGPGADSDRATWPAQIATLRADLSASEERLIASRNVAEETDDDLCALVDAIDDNLCALVDAIDDALPSYVLDDGSGDHANPRERVAYAGRELRQMGADLAAASKALVECEVIVDAVMDGDEIRDDEADAARQAARAALARPGVRKAAEDENRED